MAVVLHIGLARAASTYLQERVFCGLPGIATPFADGEGRRLLWRIGRQDSAEFDERAVGEEVSRRATQARAVVSWEGFSANDGSDRRIRCERLARLFPAATILCIIRRQDDLLRSHYGGAAGRGLDAFGMRRFPSIDEWLETAPKRAPSSTSGPPLLAVGFDLVLREYVRAFGAGSVTVLPYEALRDDKDRFAAELADCLGADCAAVRSRLDEAPLRQAVAGRHVKFRLRRGMGAAARLRALLRPGLRADIGPEWQARIAERHGPGNRWIARTFGLDLAAYGYPGIAG